jgi:hypothetical protein
VQIKSKLKYIGTIIQNIKFLLFPTYLEGEGVKQKRKMLKKKEREKI